MTEFNFKKHVKIVCDLSIGEKIKIEGWGYKFDGKELTIEDIKLANGNCESGVQIKVSDYDNYIDSNWATKIQSQQQ